jgi:hypothetical protein
MIKSWKKFNEEISLSNLFGKKEDPDAWKKDGPKVMSDTGRPVDDGSNPRAIPKFEPVKVEPRIDKSFLQEISDRLYGPDSEDYMDEIKEINKKYRKRPGKAGNELFDPESDIQRKKREEVINRQFPKI